MYIHPEALIHLVAQRRVELLGHAGTRRVPARRPGRWTRRPATAVGRVRPAGQT